MQKYIELGAQRLGYTLKVSKRARHMRLAVYCDGAVVVTAPWWVGQSKVEQFVAHKSRWILDKLNYFKRFDGQVFFKRSKRDFLEQKAAALALVQARVAHFNTLYNFTFKRIAVKNPKTRWGSCSKKGNLNFNYRLVHLPERLVDYVVVHELCHLQEFNHSRKFWELVGKTIPNYVELKRELKRNRVG